MTKTYFLTGTDTGVGKTVVSCALLQAAAKHYRVAGYKPVASGCDNTPEGLRNSDAVALQAHSSMGLAYEEVNPCAFELPTSPHIISEKQQKPIYFEQMHHGLHHLQNKADWIIVEGAGGWYTPLSSTKTFANWVVEADLPVILTVGVKLGCINHAVLTAQAICHAGLPLVGYVANEMTVPGQFQQEYLTTLSQLIPAPCLGVVPYLSEMKSTDPLAHYVNIAALIDR